MYYQTTNDLPKGVSDNLPQHAQAIYKDAFNNAYEEYKDPSKRYGDESRVAVAAKVAWSAVEHVYTKDAATGDWVKK